MAEIVQKNRELSAPEIIELNASKLFKDSEIRNLIMKRDHFDYKMNNITKSLQDFEAAIQLEKGLLLDLMKRRRARNLPLKKQNLDFLIIKRIQRYYSQAMVHFSDDYRLYLEYFNFFRQYKSYHTVITEHVRKMIQKFESNPQVFKVAASWFYKTINQKEALKILHRGLARHPLDVNLYLDLIELELKEPDDAKLMERLKKYVDDILRNVPNHTFLIEVLNILQHFPRNSPSLKEVQNYIIDRLLEKYWTEEDVWHVIAVREYKGFYYKATQEEENNKTTRKSIKRCVSRYKEGITRLPLKKQSALWKLYLNTLTDLQKENRDAAVSLKTHLLQQALEDARKANIKLDEMHWAAWIDACGTDEELLVKKLDEGTREHPQSSMLWALYLRHYILKDNSVQAEQIFARAIRCLGPRSTFIWEMYIDYHLLKSPVSEVNALYMRAVSEPYEEISKVFKPRYLTWTVLSSGLEAGRKVYWEMAEKPLFCKELHEEMINIELMEYHSENKTNHLKVIALYAKQFGHQEIDIWIQWITLIRDQKGFDQNEKEKQVYERAIKALPERLANDFKEKYYALT